MGKAGRKKWQERSMQRGWNLRVNGSMRLSLSRYEPQRITMAPPTLQ